MSDTTNLRFGVLLANHSRDVLRGIKKAEWNRLNTRFRYLMLAAATACVATFVAKLCAIGDGAVLTISLLAPTLIASALSVRLKSSAVAAQPLSAHALDSLKPIREYDYQRLAAMAEAGSDRVITNAMVAQLLQDDEDTRRALHRIGKARQLDPQAAPTGVPSGQA